MKNEFGKLDMIIDPFRMRKTAVLISDGIDIFQNLKFYPVQMVFGNTISSYLKKENRIHNLKKGIVGSWIALASRFGIILPWIQISETSNIEENSLSIQVQGVEKERITLDDIDNDSIFETYDYKITNSFISTVEKNLYILIGREETNALIELYRISHPYLISEIKEKNISIGLIQKVLQIFLKNNIIVKHFPQMIEYIIEYNSITDPQTMADKIHHELSKDISNLLYGKKLNEANDRSITYLENKDLNIDENDDDLFQQALEIVKHENIHSPSELQRRLRIGYNKAVSLMEKIGHIKAVP